MIKKNEMMMGRGRRRRRSLRGGRDESFCLSDMVLF